VFAIAALVLRYIRVGRDIRAIGGDRHAARTAGVRVDRLLIGVFIVSAVGAALTGALLSYGLATASPTNIGVDVLTFSATAALLGGVSLSGGRGNVIGIAAGVLSLSVLEEILAILNSAEYVSNLVTGALLLIVTIVWAPGLSQWFKLAAIKNRA
jgi:ribose/xylose/arabinose/galactoside ABC-type transport system permease subunit